MDKYNIFVRISYKDMEKNEEKLLSNTRVNNKVVNGSRYLIGGGVYNRKKGGTIIFTAKSLQEIKQVTEGKPLIKDASLKYNVAIIPKTII